MHKFRILQQVSRGQLAREEAAVMLNTSEKAVLQLQTIWSEHLPALIPLIDKILEPKNTKREQTKIKARIAEVVGVTYRQVNRLLKSAEITVPSPKSSEKRKKQHENAKKRRVQNEKHAFDVIYGLSDVENAATQAELSVRQMYRLCNKLTKSQGTPFGALAAMTESQRRKIAKAIERSFNVRG